MNTKNTTTCHNLILKLQQFWSQHGCIIMQPIDITVGAGTFHYHTFLKAIGPEPLNMAYLQTSRRPTDGRYGQNPNRLQQYYQFQVVIKPAPKNIQLLYLQSLKNINLNPIQNDIRFIEDNWENPTLGAWGIGWEIWLNGMEITQFTYFQQIGGLNCDPVTVEITYGIERIAMNLQNVNTIYEIVWDKNKFHQITYKELFYQNEIEQSIYNFQHSNIHTLSNLFNQHLLESERLLLLKPKLIVPAYEHILYATHNFNLIDAKQIISNTERKQYISKIRKISTKIAKCYYKFRKKKGFPLLYSRQNKNE
ncbi:glycine--tRNA ligase subunit alpha [Buchnera aphidicola]|uniref:Glycine--tRNA ligase alpha subunit n=1 Tax=Buchnera aphidicola (Stegophylla sp.) TaxID=2315800 RepID=A0A4D6YKB8_9GAMM|nr:glycine--tRNA ligase subunit alpha [Buchnera aphidicola (Stegophylla sp.)]QCI26280.1 glycine--tRNA ligase subunit alpha [Buchnera aphidicola (Stegophylla sp.)]